MDNSRTATPENIEPIPVAVFDFDGTTIGAQSGRLFTTYLFKHGMLSPLRMIRLAWWGLRYLFHAPVTQESSRELLFGALEGLTADQVDSLMRGFHNEVLARFYRPKALAEATQLKRDGYIVLLVSATFRAIAESAAHTMGADACIATEMERDEQGRYTGRVQGPVIVGEQKFIACAHWCNCYLGEGRWVLQRAYGDHHTDKYLFQHAQEAFAVCPGQTLERAARKNGWSVLDWSCGTKTASSSV